MNRTLLAFIVAPLWVPAATALYAARMFPYHEQFHWIVITTIIGAVFGYCGVLLVGLPAFLFLRAHDHAAISTAVVLGFVIGGTTWLIFAILFGLSLGNSLTFIWRDASNWTNWSAVTATGVLGAVVGATLWSIARPDRPRSNVGK